MLTTSIENTIETGRMTVISHTDNDKTRATYNHAKWLRNRRSMLQWYADFLDGKAEMPVHEEVT